jgi:hypothetical protein
MGGQFGCAASRLPSAKTAQIPASETGDLEGASMGGHEAECRCSFCTFCIDKNASNE